MLLWTVLLAALGLCLVAVVSVMLVLVLVLFHTVLSLLVLAKIAGILYNPVSL
jgi:hypothetical protein